MHFSKKFGLLSLCALIPTIPVSSFATGADDGTTVTSKVYVDNKLDLKQNKLPYDATANLIIAPTTDGGEATKRAITTAGTGITGLTNNSADTDKQKIPTAYAVNEAISSATSGVDVSTNTVNGAPLSNAASYYYGSGVGGNTAATKTVSIPSITTLAAGQVIVVNPVTTSKTISTGMKLKLNDFDAYQIKYSGNDVGESYYSTVWTANVPSIFVFDGSNWVFAGKGFDSNTTYSALSQTKLDTGTETTGRLVSAKLLRDNFYTETETDDLLNGKQDTLIAGTNITIGSDGKTISATDTNTTYSAGTGLSLSGTTFSNAGVRSVTESASTAADGTIAVNTNGATTNPAVKGWANKQDKLVAGTNITIAADGKTISATDTTYDVFTTSANGLVPKASASGDTGKFLKGDGTWGTPTDTNTTYTASNGVTLTGTNFTNSGVRAVSASDSSAANGTIKVNTNGTDAHVAVKGWSTKQDKLVAGTNITIAADGKTISATDTTYNEFTGATSSADGAAGLVKKPLKANANQFLKGDGSWATPTDTNTTYSAGTGLSLSGTTFSNAGVRSVTESASTAADGTIAVNTNGATTNPAVKGWANKQDKLVAGTNITIAADGKTISATDTTYNEFTGATSSADGAAGLVKKPLKANANQFLKGDGTWATPTDTNTTYSADNVTIQKNSSNQFSAKTAAVANGGTALTTGDQVYDFVTTQGYITNAAIPTTLSAFTDDIDAANKINNVTLNGGNPLTVTGKTVDIPLMGAASSSVAGSMGLVPAPAKGDQAKVLSGAGTWVSLGNATLTVQKNGTSVGTFTANATSNKSINIAVPTTVSELTDSANYELVSRKAKQGTATGSIFTDESTDDQYPSAKAVYTALNAQSTSAGNTYQPKSTAAYQMGKAGGGWETMTSAQQNALNSGITSTKVTNYDNHLANTTVHITAAERTAWNAKENSSNKLAQGSATTSVIADNSTNDTKFPTAKAVVKYVTDQGYITNAAIPTTLSAFTDDIDAANKINNVTLNGGNPLTVTGKTVDIPLMGAASSSVAGSMGLVPAPAKGDQAKVLSGAKTWVVNSTTTVANGDGSTTGTSAVDGSVKVTKDGTTTYPVVKGWANKQDKLVAGTNITIAADGKTISATDTTYNEFTGATSSADGAAGLVKKPLIANRAQFLRGDGTWATPTDNNTTYSADNVTIQKNSSNQFSAKTAAVANGGTALTTGDQVYDFVTTQGYITNAAIPTKLSEFTDDIDAANTINTVKANGTALTVNDKAVNIPNMTAATASAAGKGGLVPAPSAGAQTKFLRGDGTWVVPTDNNTTYSADNVTIQKNSSNQFSAKTAAVANGGTALTTGDQVYDFVTTQGYITSAAVPTKLSQLTDDIDAANVLNSVKLNGTALTIDSNKAVNIPLMGVASSSAAGTVGLVPASSAGDQAKVLTAGRTWAVNSTTTVTNSDGSTVATSSSANDGSIKVTKDGTTTYPVVRGWSNKQNKPSSVSNGKVLTYTGTDANGNVSAKYIQVPVANDDPNNGGTLNSTTPLASIWVE